MNADTLLAKVKSDGALPSTGNLSDSLIVDKINSELKSIVAMLIEAERQEFFTDILDVALLSTQSAYSFPERAMASTARVVKFVDSSGAEDPKPLPEIPLSQVGDYAFLSGNPVGFYVTATDINPLPRPGSGTSGSLRWYYARRPSSLVLDTVNANGHTQVFTIDSIAKNGANTNIILSGLHDALGTGVKIDIQGAKSPFKLLAKDVAVTDASANVNNALLICNGVDLTTIGAVSGDFVTLAKTSYIPMLPEEAHDMLRDFAIARCLNDINLKDRGASFSGTAEMRFKTFLKVTAPRMNQSNKPISAWKGWRRRSIR